MFGSRNGNTPTPSRPAAADVARIEGNLTHVLVASNEPDGINLFLNAVPVSTGEIESLSIEIIAPESNRDPGTLTGILARYTTGADGNRTQQAVALFPGTVELISPDRRLTVTCMTPGVFDGLWLGLGLKADGTSSELTGVQSLRVLVTPDLFDAKLTWSEDGTTEEIFPPGG